MLLTNFFSLFLSCVEHPWRGGFGVIRNITAHSIEKVMGLNRFELFFTPRETQKTEYSNKSEGEFNSILVIHWVARANHEYSVSGDEEIWTLAFSIAGAALYHWVTSPNLFSSFSSNARPELRILTMLAKEEKGSAWKRSRTSKTLILRQWCLPVASFRQTTQVDVNIWRHVEPLSEHTKTINSWKACLSVLHCCSSDSNWYYTALKTVASSSWARTAWCPWKESNLHYPAPKASVSTNWTTWTKRKWQESNPLGCHAPLFSRQLPTREATLPNSPLQRKGLKTMKKETPWRFEERIVVESNHTEKTLTH